MDDGHAHNKKHIKLATDGFDKPETEFLCSLLNNYLKEKIEIIENKDNQYQIHIRSVAAEAFISEINPIYPSFMQRKINW